MDRLSLFSGLMLLISIVGNAQELTKDPEISRINSAIIAYPNRLDLRIDQIKLLGDSGLYERYTDAILALLDQDGRNRGDWWWKDGNRLTNMPDFMLQYFDSFTVQLYNRNDPALHPLMDRISKRVLDSYPTHVPSLSNLAITALYRKDYEAGISYLTQARSIAPTNTSVLSNLAYAYAQNGQVETAIDCYREVIQYGDAQTQEYARKQIEELENRE